MTATIEATLNDQESHLHHRRQAEPIRAWKRAEIALAPEPLLSGIGMNARYHPVDTAIHYPDEVHPAPRVDCACGFYGVPGPTLSSWRAWYGRHGAADLEVELYGRVVRCEGGWRAEKQRVLAVWLDPDCVICGEPAIGVGIRGPQCWSHGWFWNLNTDLLSPAALSDHWKIEVAWRGDSQPGRGQQA